MSRKRKKEDRAKTQLKKPKTAPGKHLPKGTNETKTEFKVTKIVIPGQQINTTSCPDGPTTSKNIGIKEVMHKMTHFSQAVRSDGLEGLKELLSSPSSRSLVAGNLSKLTATLVTLVQDREKKIRKLAVSLLGQSLGQVSPGQVRPLHPLLSAHLSCCLTNIDPRIQQDGLTLLDALIDSSPDFVESHFSGIIPNCLDQISNKKSSGSKGPNVAANVTESMTALQWRLAVLTRVNKILELAVNKDRDNAVKEGAKHVEHVPGQYHSLLDTGLGQPFSLSTLTEGQSSSSICDNIMLLMPLLIETWVEARAGESKASKSSNLTSDCVDLLANIAGIMDKLLVIAGNTTDSSEGAQILHKVKSKFWGDIKQQFLKYLPFKSSNVMAQKCNALLCCVNIALDPALSTQMADVSVKICGGKHVPIDLKIRVSRELLDKNRLDDNQKESLLTTLTSLSSSVDHSKDKQTILGILQREAELCPGQKVTQNWIENLPDQIIRSEEEAKQDLLNICLHLLKTSNRCLAERLVSVWDQVDADISRCKESEVLGKTLGFINFYCTKLTV